MQFSSAFILLLASSLAPLATANLHNKGICVNYQNDNAVYNANATTAACTAYLNRNTGSAQWDTCPDCYMVTDVSPAYCNSDAEHLGGDEITAYCVENGADNALTS